MKGFYNTSGSLRVPDEDCNDDFSQEVFGESLGGARDCGNTGGVSDTIIGCTDALASNYNPYANVANNSLCNYVVGCTDFNYEEFDPYAVIPNPSMCETLKVYGCTNPNSFNYNPNASTNDGSCVDFLNGCTDGSALNYNPSANVDDGSCSYPPIIDETIDVGEDDPFTDMEDDIIVDTEDDVVVPPSDTDTDLITPTGCTNMNASNYDPNATFDDGSCIFPSDDEGNANLFLYGGVALLALLLLKK